MGVGLFFRRSFANNKSRTGLTIAEVLVVVAIFGILFTAIFAIFQVGLSAFHKTTTKNELLQELQVTNFRLASELERSTLASLAADDLLEVSAFLSAFGNDGDFVTDTRGRPEWQRYVVYYRNTTQNAIYRAEVPLVIGASQRRVATPIEFYNSGGGPSPLASYANGGQPLSRFVTDFRPRVLPAPVSQLIWDLRVERKRYGSQRPETLTTTVAIHLRN
jgi:competence protein ComGC